MVQVEVTVVRVDMLVVVVVLVVVVDVVDVVVELVVMIEEVVVLEEVVDGPAAVRASANQIADSPGLRAQLPVETWSAGCETTWYDAADVIQPLGLDCETSV